MDERTSATAFALVVALALGLGLYFRATVGFPGPIIVTARDNPTVYWLRVAILGFALVVGALIAFGL